MPRQFPKSQRLSLLADHALSEILLLNLALQLIVEVLSMRRAVIIGLLCLPYVVSHAEKMRVKIVQRQVNENGYSNFVPGHAYSTANGSVSNCGAAGNSVDCSGSSSGYTTYTAPHSVGYNVTGATFTLLLNDGRLAIVNCVSKYSPKGDYINRRSCRMPLVDDVDVEFKGSNAKLFWVVSIDGKKTDSETYKVLAVLPAEKPSEASKP